jgi:DNA polymerase
MNKVKEMERIKDELVQLSATPLYSFRVQCDNSVVMGRGSLDANIVFVGEAPGKKESETGKPFCGASGRVLDELLASIALNRELVYITNIVKDRPPENRDPTAKEIALYGPFLDRELAIIEPRVIATLGRFSMTYIMEKFGLTEELDLISVLHGKEFIAQAPYGEVTIIPLYHPAVAVYNAIDKRVLLSDFSTLKKF